MRARLLRRTLYTVARSATATILPNARDVSGRGGSAPNAARVADFSSAAGGRVHSIDGCLALSLAEAARALGVSERHVREIPSELPHVHLGRRVVIPVDSLREWLRDRARAERSRAERAAEEIVAALSD